MNIVDAACIICNRPLSWLSGTPRWHSRCIKEKIAEIERVRSGNYSEIHMTTIPTNHSHKIVQEKAPVKYDK